jgi:hypothetical protein
VEELDASVIINIRELQSLVTISMFILVLVVPCVCTEFLHSRARLHHFTAARWLSSSFEASCMQRLHVLSDNVDQHGECGKGRAAKHPAGQLGTNGQHGMV